jgi:hypothetical protein
VQPLPFAICAFNDEMALAALAALPDLKIAVPDAVRVIGHDNMMIAELSIPPLTTIGLETPDLVERLIASVLSVCQGAGSGNRHAPCNDCRTSIGIDALIDEPGAGFGMRNAESKPSDALVRAQGQNFQNPISHIIES